MVGISDSNGCNVAAVAAVVVTVATAVLAATPPVAVRSPEFDFSVSS